MTALAAAEYGRAWTTPLCEWREDDPVLQRLTPDEQLWTHNVWTFVARSRARFPGAHHPDVTTLFRERMPHAEADLARMLGCARGAISEWLHYDTEDGRHLFCEWLLSATPGWGANPVLLARYAAAHDELYALLGEMQRRCAGDAAIVAPVYARAFEAPCPEYRPRDQAEATWLEAQGTETGWLLSNLLVLVERAKFALTLRRQRCEGLRGATPDSIPALLSDARAVWPLAQALTPALWARPDVERTMHRCEALFRT